jgi:hypothetical protein
VAAHPTRRVMLAAAAILPLAAVSGCDGVDVLDAPPSPAPDVTVLREAIAAEQLLITWYAAVLRDAGDAGGGSPAALTTVLQPLLAEHHAHLAQLRSRLVVPAGSAPSPSPARQAAPPAGPGAGSAGVTFLRDAEQAAAAAMLGRTRNTPGSLAQLFASISASEATHVPVLDAAAAGTTSRVTG